MVDNFTYTPGSGETGAADDIDGVKYPRVKVVIGANNTNDGDISSANPMPISGSVTADLGANNDVTVTSGTVTANAGTNLNTSALALETGGNLAAIKAKTDNIPALGQALAAGSVPVVLTAAQQTALTPPAAITGFATETTLASVKTAVETIDNAIAGTEMQVDVVTLPTVTANATLAAETTKVIGTVNVAASQTIAVTNTGTFATQATLAAETTKVIGTINVASGQTIGLAAGSNAIGKLAANSGVDIGDVDVLSLPALAAGTNAVGKLLPPDIDITTHTNYARKYYTSTGAATDGIVWSPAAGKRWHVTSLIFQVSADATVTFEDDKAGGDDVVLKGEFKAGSGLALTFDEKYPFASGEDAADLLVTTSAGNIYITVVGFEI